MKGKLEIEAPFPTTFIDEMGRVIEGYRINFTTPKGAKGFVNVTKEELKAGVAKGKIEEEAKLLDSLME